MAGPAVDETLATARMPVLDHERVAAEHADQTPPPSNPAVPAFAPPPGMGPGPRPAEASNSPVRLIALIGAGIVALLVIALLAIWLRGRGDDGDTTAATDTSAAESTTTSPDGVPSTQPSSTTTTSNPALSSTTTTSSRDQSTTTADTTEQIAMFRDLLEENGLTSDELSDTDVVQFGTSFCALARFSDADTFDDYRNQAINETENSELNDDELKLVIDAAVLSFCPDEAERLGIEL
ncbi:MAG: hypothetical protein ACK5PP_03440 [Acidimicrobiales bacterium]